MLSIVEEALELEAGVEEVGSDEETGVVAVMVEV